MDLIKENIQKLKKEIEILYYSNNNSAESLSYITHILEEIYSKVNDQEKRIQEIEESPFVKIIPSEESNNFDEIKQINFNNLKEHKFSEK